MKKITLVIVNWNGGADTARCLTSVSEMVTTKNKLETVVVDNGSADESVKRIAAEFPWVTLITLDKNLGFSGGNNVGIRYAMRKGADAVWLLNNDTIVDKNALCLGDALNGSTGVVGSKIYFAPGHEFHKNRYKKKERGNVIWFAGGEVDWENMYASHRGVDEVDTGQYDMEEETQFITGCSMMIARSVVDAIGILDDKYYLYLEDLDYCMRAKRAGFKMMYHPTSVIWHINAGSSGGAGNSIHDYYLTRNRLLVGFRYAPIRTRLALLRESMSFVFGKNSEKKQAVLDALFGRWGGKYEQKK